MTVLLMILVIPYFLVVGSQAPHTWQMWRAAASPEMNLVKMEGVLEVAGMMGMVDMKTDVEEEAGGVGMMMMQHLSTTVLSIAFYWQAWLAFHYCDGDLLGANRGGGEEPGHQPAFKLGTRGTICEPLHHVEAIHHNSTALHAAPEPQTISVCVRERYIPLGVIPHDTTSYDLFRSE